MFSDKAVYRSANTHWCKLTNARQYVKYGVCTLPYLFLRYAKQLDLMSLIYLGLQICGRHQDRKPICSVRKLHGCASALEGHAGRRKALQAIRHISDNSFSPAESKLFMQMCLPNHLGGCGFPKAILNHKIQAGGKTFILDICFPAHKFGVEYDSFQFHNNSNSFSLDNLRDAKINAARYKTIHVRPGQLDTIDGFYDLMTNVSRLLGKPIRIRSTKYIDAFQNLFYLFEPHRKKPLCISNYPPFRGVRETYEAYLRKEAKEKRASRSSFEKIGQVCKF